MKTKHFIIVLAAMLLPCFAIAQSATEAIFKKYAEQKEVSSVIISSDLIKLLIPSDKGSKITIAGKEVDTKGVDLSKIKNIKILNFEGDGPIETYNNFVAETSKALDNPKYTEMMQVKSAGQFVKILVVKNKTMIQETVVYVKNEEEKTATLIYVDGEFSEDAIKELIKSANIIN